MARPNDIQQLDPVEGSRQAVETALGREQRQGGPSGDGRVGNGSQGDGDRESRIRARAYELWENSGRAEGQEMEHWDAARREIETTEKTPPIPPM